MNGSPPKNPSGLLIGLVLLIALAALAPMLIAVSRALLPLVIVLTVAIIALRLVFFHTRNW